jgi:hypothetical protein
VRIEITRGEPTPEEVAALVVALHRAGELDAADRLVPVLPAWLVAARLEGVGGGLATAPGDLS